MLTPDFNIPFRARLHEFLPNKKHCSRREFYFSKALQTSVHLCPYCDGYQKINHKKVKISISYSSDNKVLLNTGYMVCEGCISTYKLIDNVALKQTAIVDEVMK